jgi:hypothetical protein
MASLRVACSSGVSRTETALGFPEDDFLLWRGKRALRLEVVEVLLTEAVSAIEVDFSLCEGMLGENVWKRLDVVCERVGESNWITATLVWFQ